MNKWLLVLLIALVALPVLIVISAIGAAFYYSRDVAPPNTADLVPDRVEIADADNAFTHFNAAAAAAEWPKDDELLLDILDGRKTDTKHVAAVLAKNEKALALVERGLACHICQGPEVVTINDPMEYIKGWRTLNRLLVLEGAHERRAGRWGKATSACCKSLRLSNLIEKSPSGLVAYLAGISILEQSLTELRSLATSPDVPKAELRRLGEALAAVEPLDRGVVQAFKADYQTSAYTIDALHEGKIDLGEDGKGNLPARRTGGYLFQPNRTKLMFAELCRSILKSVRLPRTKRPSVEAEAERIAGKRVGSVVSRFAPNAIGWMLLGMLAPCEEALLEAHCRTVSHLAATRLVVACRRYELDHGKLPPTLDAIVPDYLDAVPADPYDGKPFRYVRDKAIVYSINKDLVDSGGSDKPTRGKEPESEFDRLYYGEDAVFYLHARPSEKGQMSKARMTKERRNPKPGCSSIEH